MRVEARDNGKAWKPGYVTSVNPLKVKIDGELSGVSWDEVRPYDEAKAMKEKSKGALGEFQKKIMEDAQEMVRAAKEGALQDLKFAIERVKELATAEDLDMEKLKSAKALVAEAIKAAQAKGVSKEELVEASSDMAKAKAKEESVKEEKKEEERSGC